MTKLGIIILAAGLGKRMKSPLPKVAHKLCGKPLIKYSIET
ncbi:MAG TPA: NTP transferase domain-containing protein, partial [bacterium]|nr:NTP transferase domain-containing protein [bacterium]